MRADHSHRHFPPRPRNAPQSRASIVVRDVLHEPVDRVVGVRALVGLARALLDRTMMNELALGTETPAHVLIDDDVSLFREPDVRSDHRRVLVGSIGWDTVSGAGDEQRISLRLIL